MPDPEITGIIRIQLEGERQTAESLKKVREEQERLLEAVRRQRQTNLGIAQNRELAAQERLIRDNIAAINQQQSPILANLRARQAETKALAEQTAELAKQKRIVESTPVERPTQNAIVRSAVGAAPSSKSGGLSTLGSAAERLAGSVGLGGVNDALGVVNDVVDVTQALGGLGVSSAALLPVLAGGAVATVAFGGALKDFIEKSTEARRNADAASQSITTYFQTLREGTTKSIQEAKAKAEVDRAAAEKELALRETYRDKTFDALKTELTEPVKGLGIFGEIAADAAARLRVAGEDLLSGGRGDKDNQKRIEDLQTTINKATGDIAGFERALADGTTAAADAAEAEKQLAAERAKLAQKRVDEIASTAAAEAEARRLGRDGSSEELKRRRQQIADDKAQIAAEIRELEKENTDEAKARIKTLRGDYKDLSIAEIALINIAKPMIDAREKEADAIAKQKKALEDGTKALQESLRIRDQVTALEKDRSEQLADRARDDSRAAQVSPLERQIAAAKEAEAAAKSQQKIIDLRKESAKQETDAKAKLKSSIAKIDADYMASELKALQDFRLEEARDQEDFARERLRKLEDLNAELNDLASQGDVAGFIRAQRQGMTDLRRGDENQQTDSARRLEDFRLQSEKAQQAREEQLRDLQNSFEEERRVRQAEAQKRIDQEVESGKTQLKQSELLQQQLAALRDKFAEEDLIRRRQQEDDAYKQQVAAFKKRQEELAPVIAKGADILAQGAGKFLQSLSADVVGFITKIRSAASGSGGKGKSSGTVVNNAEGGIYAFPNITDARLAEKPGWGDIVIPFKQSEGIGPAIQRVLAQTGRGGGNDGAMLPPINVYVTTGSVASKEDVGSVQMATISAVQSALKAAKGGG